MQDQDEGSKGAAPSVNNNLFDLRDSPHVTAQHNIMLHNIMLHNTMLQNAMLLVYFFYFVVYLVSQSVISCRRLTRCRGLPERLSSWFSPLK